MTIHITLFGHFSISGDEANIPLIGSARLRELLAYLLLHRHVPQERKQIAFCFWPDTPETQALGNLRALLNRLRRAWPECDHFLAVDERTIQWRPDCSYTLDVATFEDELALADQAMGLNQPLDERRNLENATEQYGGPLLASHYAEWMLAKREQFEQSYLRALERLSRLWESERHYEQAIAVARRIINHDPLHEAIYRQLMRLYALNGDSSLALRTYHSCATVLSRELGVEPDEPTRALYRRLVRRDQADQLEDPSVSRSQQPGLIGREDEWRSMLSVWQQVVDARRPHILLLSGEAGVGKSRLAEELYDWVTRQGIASARSRSYEAEGRMAYAPLVEWLRSNGLRRSLTHLDSVWLTEIARLLPELMEEDSTLPTPTPLVESWQRMRLFEALARAFSVDEQPRLLLLDDLQWCDDETIAWLRFFLHHRSARQSLIVGTFRPDEVGTDHRLRDLISVLESEGEMTSLSLGPLNCEESVALAEQIASESLALDLHGRFFQETGGIPLFIVEMAKVGLKQWASGTAANQAAPELPTRVQAVIHSRLERLSPSARSVAELAAAAGRSFTFPMLAAAIRIGEEILVEALDELWQRGIIREHGSAGYDFSHDRIRDVAYAEIGPVRRSFLHRRLAASLEQVFERDLESVAGQIAVHYERGERLEEALVWTERAAVEQGRRYASSEVVALLTHGLSLLSALPKDEQRQKKELELLCQLMDALVMQSGPSAPELGSALKRAETLAREIGDGAQLFDVLSRMIKFEKAADNVARALELCAEHLRIAKENHSPELQMIAHHHAARTHMHLGEFRLALERFQEYLALEPSDLTLLRQVLDRDPRIDFTWATHGLTLWLLGYPDQAGRWAKKALRFADQHSDKRFMSSVTYGFVAFLFRELGDWPRFESATERIVSMSTRFDLGAPRNNGALCRGLILARQGSPSEGIACAEQGVESCRQLGQVMFQTYRLDILAYLQIQATQLSDADQTLQEAFDLSSHSHERWWDAELYRHLGDLRREQQASPRSIEDAYQKSLKIARSQAARSLELRTAMALGRHWLEHGRHRAAHNLLVSVYASFTEGFESADLVEARKLLAQLST